MTADPELDRCLAAMGAAFRALTAEPDRVLEGRGLGRAHHRALFILRRDGELAVGDLARGLGVSTQALHKTLKPLLILGLVEARADAQDARVRILTPTSAGLALEAEVSGLQRAAFARVAAQLGPQALAAWTETTEALAVQAARGT